MATVDGYLLSPSERLFIREGMLADIRTDGRTQLEYRHFNVEYGVVPQAVGSSKVSLGDTEVLVAVKGDICEAKVGQLVFMVDSSSPSLCQLREADDRTSRQNSLEVKASVLSRILSDSFDLEQLEIAGGRFSWTLLVDVLIMNDAGNLMDAIFCAVRAALSHARLPKVMVEGGEAVGLSVSEDPADSQRLICGQLSVLITLAVYSVDGEYILAADPTSAEEASSDCLVGLGVDDKSRITFCQKWYSGNSTGAIGTCPAGCFEKAASLARSLGPSLISETGIVVAIDI